MRLSPDQLEQLIRLLIAIAIVGVTAGGLFAVYALEARC